MMEKKLSYRLENFEGPLDLLLFLIAKKKLQIVDISISELVDQYMEQIEAMREQDMDIASEFVEMAARLVYIKTVSLLPKHEEAEELKKELEGQLLEYQECKRVAAQLSKMISFDAYTSCLLYTSFAGESEKLPFVFEMDLSDTEWSGQYPFISPISVEGSVSAVAGEALLEAKVSFEFSMPCARCMEEIRE